MKIAAWNKRQAVFLKQTGFKRRQAREETAGFSYKDQKNASNEAIEYYNVWSKSMGVDDAIKTLANYYEVKYTDSPRYELLRRYVRDVNSGWISPLSGFANYEGLYNRIQTEIVGRTTVNGVLITGQSEHFLQRVIGTMVDPKILKKDHQIIRRSGVEFEDIMDAVSRGMPRKIRNNPNGRSQKFVAENCVITVNPDTGMLVQCNPSDR